MEEIKIKIKMSSNEKLFIIPIYKSDTILKLKEKCEKETNIPVFQQNLIYEGRILLNEKLIKDYNLDNEQTIILVKEHAPINLISEAFSNLGLNPNDLGNISPPTQIISNLNLNETDPHNFNQFLRNPLNLQIFNNMLKEPSILQMMLNSPFIQIQSRNNPLFQSIFDSQIMQQIFRPENMQMLSNIISGMNLENRNNMGPELIDGKEDNPIDEIDFFQIIQMLIEFIGIFNSNKSGNTKIFEVPEDEEENIDYKEKYKNQLSQLKEMGFNEEEINIQILKVCNGNIENAIEKLCNIFNN